MQFGYAAAIAVVMTFTTAIVGTAEATEPQERELPAPAAWAALERGDAAKAAAIFREELERSPRNAMLYYGAGYAAFTLGRSDAAISALKRAIEYNPRFVPAMVLLSQVAYQGADLDLALRTMEKAAALAPGDRAITQQLEQWRRESALHSRFEERPGARFRVLFEGAAEKTISDRVAGVLESVYWSIGKRLNSYPGETLTVILYTNRQFQDITRAPAWAGGGYDGRIRLPVEGALRSPKTLDRVVTHEFVHAVITNAAPRGVPTWIHEGLASYLESSDRSWVARVLKSAGVRIPLEDLADGFDRFDGETALVAYAESLVGGQLLCERLGANVGPFLQMLGSGHTVDQALSTHGVQPDSFYAQWRARIGVK
ncbi:MAG: tetratricopeptide repeat protein [Acidobacteria bacterium]|nr:tetratricopeptide repeat protein [Acidobacteriota bacterium]MCA1650810.1 tetratricopeptide repeat protein [Acidobacteriota bacterium]